MSLTDAFVCRMSHFLIGFNAVWTICLYMQKFSHEFTNPLTSIIMLVVIPSLISVFFGVTIGLSLSHSVNKINSANLPGEHKHYGSTQPLWPKPLNPL